jgi:hypothetical protein
MSLDIRRTALSLCRSVILDNDPVILGRCRVRRTALSP